MKKVETERTVVLSDTHFPYQDDKAITAALEFVKYTKPQRIILNGDIPDHYGISRFSKEPERKLSLQREVDEVRNFLRQLRETAPKAEIIWLEGNHEVRLRHFLMDRAPELYYLDDLQIEKLYRVSEYKVEYVRANSRGATYDVGPIKVGHYNVARKWSGWSAKELVLGKFTSVVHGHVHRLGSFYHRANGKQYIGQEGGCLCMLDPEYLDDCDWQQGIVLIQKVTNSKRFFVTEVPIIEGRILYDGREFGEE